MRWPYVIVVLLLLPVVVFPATIRIPQDQPSIQAGIDVAFFRDTVLVSPGTYTENLDFQGKALTVRSTCGALATELRPRFPTETLVKIMQSEPSGVMLSGFTLVGGSCDYVVRIANNSQPTLRDCIFRGYTGSNVVIRCDVPDALIQDNLFFNNGGNGCVGIYTGAARIINNTFDGNARGITTTSGAGTARNNIVTNSTGFGLSGTFTKSEYNDIWNNNPNYTNGASGGTGSISVDPLFVDRNAANYRLAAGSPCINTGDPSAVYNDPDGTRSDIGARPLAASGYPLPLGLSFSFSCSPLWIKTLTPDINWHYTDTSSTDQQAYEIQVGADSDWTFAEMWATGPVYSTLTNITYSGVALTAGTLYHLRIRVRHTSGWGHWVEIPFRVLLSSQATVPAQFGSIQSAIDASCTGDTIVISPGVYTENFILNGKSILIRSDSGSGVVLLQPEVNIRPHIQLINCPDTTTELRGVTVVSADATVGILISGGNRPVIRGCVFRGYVSGNVVIRCEMTNALITRNLFYSNSGIGCVGIYTGTANIVNNTFDSNNRGIFSVSGQGEARNNIVTRSTEYGIAGSLQVLQYNDVWNNLLNYANGAAAGLGSLSVDPLFIDVAGRNYHLPQSSPCVNAGDPAASYNDSDGSRNDMGAYPWLPPVFPPILSPIGDQGVNEANELTIEIQATDANGTIPALSVTPLPAYATFVDSGNGHGLFVWTPTYQQAGEYDVLFIASDGQLADSETVHITVYNTARPPSVSSACVEGKPSATHLTNHLPQFQWLYVDPESLPQGGFEIAVGTDNNWTHAEMWNPAAFVRSDTFVTYAGAPLADGATYYVRVRAHNGLLWSNWTGTSFQMNSAPGIPVQQSPVSNVVAGNLPTLWVLNSQDAEGDAITYDFAGFNDTDCVAGVSIDLDSVPSGMDSTGGQITSTLAENCRYWWRARSFDGYEYSEWSAYALFWVDGIPEPPTAPQPLSPSGTDGKPLFNMLPVFTWSTSFDRDPFDSVQYRLEVSSRPTFAFAYVKDSLLGPPFTLTDSLDYGTHYWWRVLAIDRTGLMTASPAAEFWTWMLGDLTHNHVVDLTDLSTLITYLIGGGGGIDPRMVGDLSGDCGIDLKDLSLLINFLTGGGNQLKPGCQ